MPDYARACRPPDYAPNYAIMPSIMARALLRLPSICLGLTCGSCNAAAPPAAAAARVLGIFPHTGTPRRCVENLPHVKRSSGSAGLHASLRSSPTPLPSDDPTPRSDSGSSDALNVGGAQPALAGRHTDACAPHPRPLLPLAERNGSFLGALTRATRCGGGCPGPAAAPPPAPPPSPARI